MLNIKLYVLLYVLCCSIYYTTAQYAPQILYPKSMKGKVFKARDVEHSKKYVDYPTSEFPRPLYIPRKKQTIREIIGEKGGFDPSEASSQYALTSQSPGLAVRALAGIKNERIEPLRKFPSIQEMAGLSGQNAITPPKGMGIDPIGYEYVKHPSGPGPLYNFLETNVEINNINYLSNYNGISNDILSQLKSLDDKYGNNDNDEIDQYLKSRNNNNNYNNNNILMQLNDKIEKPVIVSKLGTHDIINKDGVITSHERNLSKLEAEDKLKQEELSKQRQLQEKIDLENKLKEEERLKQEQELKLKQEEENKKLLEIKKQEELKQKELNDAKLIQLQAEKEADELLKNLEMNNNNNNNNNNNSNNNNNNIKNNKDDDVHSLIESIASETVQKHNKIISKSLHKIQNQVRKIITNTAKSASKPWWENEEAVRVNTMRLKRRDMQHFKPFTAPKKVNKVVKKYYNPPMPLVENPMSFMEVSNTKVNNNVNGYSDPSISLLQVKDTNNPSNTEVAPEIKSGAYSIPEAASNNNINILQIKPVSNPYSFTSMDLLYPNTRGVGGISGVNENKVLGSHLPQTEQNLVKSNNNLPNTATGNTIVINVQGQQPVQQPAVQQPVMSVQRNMMLNDILPSNFAINSNVPHYFPNNPTLLMPGTTNTPVTNPMPLSDNGSFGALRV